MINVNLLPKAQRRRKSLDPYKAVAVSLPLLVLAVCGVLQFQVIAEANRVAAQNRDLIAEQAVLEPFIDEQRALETERTELTAIQEVAASIRNGRVLWSRQLFAMLETRPSPGPQVASRMAFNALEMRALDEAARAQLVADNTYEGLDAVAEMSVAGVAGSSEVVADYIRELQDAPNFEAVLGDLSRDNETKFYAFNLTIGAGPLGRKAALDAAVDAADTAVGAAVDPAPTTEGTP